MSLEPVNHRKGICKANELTNPSSNSENVITNNFSVVDVERLGRKEQGDSTEEEDVEEPLEEEVRPNKDLIETTVEAREAKEAEKAEGRLAENPEEREEVQDQISWKIREVETKRTLYFVECLDDVREEEGTENKEELLGWKVKL